MSVVISIGSPQIAICGERRKRDHFICYVSNLIMDRRFRRSEAVWSIRILQSRPPLPNARLTVLSVVLICAHMPQILEERLVAGLLLRSEVRYVGGDIRQVPASLLYRTADSRKAVAKYNLIAGYRR